MNPNQERAEKFAREAIDNYRNRPDWLGSKSATQSLINEITKAILTFAEEENKELRKKADNLDKILGSLDVDNPNSTDALLKVLTMQAGEISALKVEVERLRTYCTLTFGESHPEIRKCPHELEIESIKVQQKELNEKLQIARETLDSIDRNHCNCIYKPGSGKTHNDFCVKYVAQKALKAMGGEG